MVDRLTSSLGKEAMLAAIRDQAGSAQGIRDDAQKMFQAALDSSGSGGTPSVDAAQPSSPASVLGDGLQAVNREVQAADPDVLAKDLMSGEISSIHEVAMRINRAKISFDFAMEVRNKLIEAYRETMRMGV